MGRMRLEKHLPSHLTNLMDTIFTRFQRVARAQADDMALVSDDNTLSYAALGDRSAHIAAQIERWFLVNQGRSVCPTDVVGISMEKCVDLYATILGVLATGASYVPLDPDLTQEVRAHIVGTCRCELIVTCDGISDSGDSPAEVTPDHAPAVPKNATEKADGSGSATIGSDICYNIFTSGSTGRPKGVMVNHVNLVNLVEWAIGEFSLTPGIQVLQYSTINFDASILDIFPTLLAGATLCIPSSEQRMSEVALADFCVRHRVNHAFLPPSLLAILSPERFAGIGTLLTGGEACSPNVVDNWAPGRRFYNLYGPTECTVLVSYRHMQRGTSPSNIGRAIPGVRLHVLDEHMRPSVRGELHVAGLAVSAGYRGDSATTDKKFVLSQTLDASVLYKTGDIVELDNKNNLIFVGRIDRQVKVRGYRIELEEIEGALLALGYAEAAVKVSAQGALVAYIVAATIDAHALGAKLAETLSEFKIPQYFVQLDTLPYRASGKVDYHSLPEPDHERKEAHTSYAPPATAGYVSIVKMWAQALRLDPDALRPDSNFLDLGGTSIKIVHLLSLFETQFGIRVKFIDFLNDPTIDFLYRSLTQTGVNAC